jgi:hypothetical protein
MMTDLVGLVLLGAVDDMNILTCKEPDDISRFHRQRMTKLGKVKDSRITET